MGQTMFRVTVRCEGILPADWPSAVADIAEEFVSRPWQKVIETRWDGDALVLVAESDYDHDGEALAAEFSDSVAACAPGTPGYRVRILSISIMGTA
jgi:hypothetical protein